MRRRIFLALAVSALLVTGCARTRDAAAPPPTPAPTSPPAPASSPPSPPAEKLRDAVPDGSEGNFRYTMKQLEGDAKGEVNPEAKRMTYTAVFKDKEFGFTMTMAVVVVDQQAWTKVTFANTKGLTGLPKLPKKWMRLDMSKVDDRKDVTYRHPDPTGAAAVFQHIVDATETSQGAFTGTVDLSAAAEAEVVDTEVLKALGEKAKKVPFEATVDRSGRLTSLTIDVPAAGKSPKFEWIAKFTDYGTAPKIKEPATSDTVAAPPELYALLNG